MHFYYESTGQMSLFKTSPIKVHLRLFTVVVMILSDIHVPVNPWLRCTLCLGYGLPSRHPWPEMLICLVISVYAQAVDCVAISRLIEIHYLYGFTDIDDIVCNLAKLYISTMVPLYMLFSNFLFYWVTSVLSYIANSHLIVM